MKALGYFAVVTGKGLIYNLKNSSFVIFCVFFNEGAYLTF